MTRSNFGNQELRKIRKSGHGLLAVAGLFSIFINLLMLTGPLYMLQIYDRVLGSQSVETLFSLTLLMGFFFAIMGVLDYARGRLLTRLSARFQLGLEHRVFTAALRRSAQNKAGGDPVNSLQDLDAVQKLLSSSAFSALFDLPWTPLFLIGITIFHPWLGGLALAGGVVLVAVAVLNQLLTHTLITRSSTTTLRATHIASQIQSEAEMVRALGMQEAAFARWHSTRDKALSHNLEANDHLARFSSLSKSLRLFLQSAMLGLGAYLAIKGEVTPGAMIAGSILLGRALAPVDLIIAQWQMLQNGHRGWTELANLLTDIPPERPRMTLPRPAAHLHAESVTVVPPGQSNATLRMVNFQIEPGQALGVIGPSGAGKSTLARVITGAWHPAGGKIRLDGAALDQFDSTALAEHIGYLPQRISLFDGTVAENIAGLSPSYDPALVVDAARRADAHEMILRLPDGYDTPLSGSSSLLSGGQMQRIGLARAIYGSPVLLVLDEPNSNLDLEGTNALNRTIRDVKSAGGSVIIMAHRPAAIAECDLLLRLDQGMVRGFGPRNEILSDHVQNAQQIQRSAAHGGMQ